MSSSLVSSTEEGETPRCNESPLEERREECDCDSGQELRHISENQVRGDCDISQEGSNLADQETDYNVNSIEDGEVETSRQSQEKSEVETSQQSQENSEVESSKDCDDSTSVKKTIIETKEDCQEKSKEGGPQEGASPLSTIDKPSTSKEVLATEEPSSSERPSPENSCTTLSAAEIRQERMKKLHELRLRKNEARKLNHVEVLEEAKRVKRPSNWEARKRRVEWEAAEEEARKQAELEGEDYEKVKRMETSALELERREKKMMRKKNPDQGFSDFAQAQYRQYERLTKQMEPDMDDYEKKRQEMGETFYPGVNTIIHGHKPSEAALDRMVADLDKQVEKRAKFSRRRGINEDADVDYINDRNMRFNKKAARFYDQYTLETKQNLERGTAV